MRIIPSWDKSILSGDSTYFGAASLMGLKAQNTRRIVPEDAIGQETVNNFTQI